MPFIIIGFNLDEGIAITNEYRYKYTRINIHTRSVHRGSYVLSIKRTGKRAVVNIYKTTFFLYVLELLNNNVILRNRYIRLYTHCIGT